jgi:hypothetical protein
MGRTPNDAHQRLETPRSSQIETVISKKISHRGSVSGAASISTFPILLAASLVTSIAKKALIFLVCAACE